MNDLIERLEKARDFPHNTCGASRHVQMLGEILSKGRTPPAFAEEPQHIGESMLATVAALYEARTEIRSAADTIERLEAERDEWKRLCDDGGKVEVHFQQLAERLEAEKAQLREQITTALGLLRPAYASLNEGHVINQQSLANGLIAPAIRRLEKLSGGESSGEAFKAMTFVEPKQWYEG